MFTDGDSITWDLGNFASPSYDWWGSAARGRTPITNIARAGLTNMVNQIQVGTFRDSVEYEQLDAQPSPPEAVFVDEEVELSIKGRACCGSAPDAPPDADAADCGNGGAAQDVRKGGGAGGEGGDGDSPSLPVLNLYFVLQRDQHAQPRRTERGWWRGWANAGGS
eukprot:gene53584-65027_t